MSRSWRRLIGLCALLVGVSLLVFTLKRADLGSGAQLSKLFGPGLALALLPGAGWHLLRTEAWRRSFPDDSRLRFATLFRIRLSAEAISYVTIAGVTGEPLKVVLLAPGIPAPVSAAATALERGAYTVVTAAVVGVAAAITAWRVPLTPQWTHIYAWIAGVAGAIAIVPPALLVGLRRPNPPLAAGPARSASRRFLRQFAAQFQALVTGDRRRVAVIVALEAGAFLMMALEVFAALALTGTRVTLLGSVAVETFTRVASLATVFIPGNVGALEVSNIAAATAIHAAGGAVALALLRRFRGLAWCIAGFLVYPRRWANDDRDAAGQNRTANDSSRTLVLIQREDSDALLAEPLGGMPAGERIARAALRAGYTRLVVWSPRRRQALWQSATSRCGARLHRLVVSDAALWHALWTAMDPAALFTVVGPGIVASPQLLAAARDLVIVRDHQLLELAAGDAGAGSGVFRTTACQLEAPGLLAARVTDPHRAEPLPPVSATGPSGVTLSIASSEALANAERVLRRSIFKPTDGRLGRFNRRISIPISIALIRSARLSAHAMSLFVIVLGLYAGWLFSRGSYFTGVAAALVSWAGSVLDGCDGELARLQFKESAFGCWVDTLGDYTYYVAIFSGMTIGAVRQTGWPLLWWSGTALGVGVMLTFTLLILLRWRATNGRPERLRSRTIQHFAGTGKRWARVVARLSTCATRATMPYGIIGFAVVGLLPAVVLLATIGAHIYWISLAREFRQLINDRTGADPQLAQLSV
jgi:phosphatidylglycerophosphate synthase